MASSSPDKVLTYVLIIPKTPEALFKAASDKGHSLKTRKIYVQVVEITTKLPFALLE